MYEQINVKKIIPRSSKELPLRDHSVTQAKRFIIYIHAIKEVDSIKEVTNWIKKCFVFASSYIIPFVQRG